MNIGPFAPKPGIKFAPSCDPTRRTSSNSGSSNSGSAAASTTNEEKTAAKALCKNNCAFSHPVLGPSWADPHSQNPQRRPGYACGFAPSDRPNLTPIRARKLRSYFCTDPKAAESVRTAEILLEAGIDINDPAFTEGNWKATPLWYAIAWGENIALARYLLQDPLSTTFPDERHSEAERRFLTVGMSVRERLLVVAHPDEDDIDSNHRREEDHAT